MFFLEAAIGFEPMNRGFANRCLGPLGYAALVAFCVRLFIAKSPPMIESDAKKIN